ncbi:hypothetical protein [Homoserinibacter sp. YIM 151385]|uniref:hypothetical protein n=1 Tax=Homoserinibacter sp. YIM 151385 TaxID=2985506 RepID=UPI0022F11701|nr:hypothetical protein [Homoserinibacter sp. YIM 151385]WBU36732.1 hypothetical protein OF852_07215 [Homoserinibacter sp. YIM 151385]
MPPVPLAARLLATWLAIRTLVVPVAPLVTIRTPPRVAARVVQRSARAAERCLR